MSDDEFDAWVGQHCEATAASADAAASFLTPAVRRAFAEWHATAAELGEVTYRLITQRRVPKFANEHAEAVAAELLALRSERNATDRPDPGAAYPVDGPRCRWCGDAGLVTVPHWRCVEIPRNAPPRLVPYRDRNVSYQSVMEISVSCDRPGCEAGVRARHHEIESKVKNPRPTFVVYLRQFGGVDVVALLGQHERDSAAHARRTAPKGGDGYSAIMASIKARVAATERRTEGEAA